MPITTAPPSLTPMFRRLALARDGGGLTDGQLLGEYVRTGDPAAFEALLRRHGPMVLGVCRRVVRDIHLADDAFQAVWIVLARRADVVRPRDHVGNWLYGVAYHSALKARRTAGRWKTREKQVTAMPHPVAPPAPAVWSDLAPILDEELARLPDVLRLPVVLCDLEGRPQRDAARQLGVPVTTLVTRLARARRTLAVRLSDRGVTLSGGALAGVLTAHAAAAAVPAPLATAAVAAAASIAAGESAAAVPAAVQHLSEGVLRMILVSKLKAASATALVVAGLSLGIGVASLPTAAGQSAPVAPAAKQPLANTHSLDDAAFLRRACVDIRGTPPTDLERALFQIDPDAKKRTKVIEWLLEEPAKSAGSEKIFKSPGTFNSTAGPLQGLTTNVASQTLSGLNLKASTPILAGFTTTYSTLNGNAIPLATQLNANYPNQQPTFTAAYPQIEVRQFEEAYVAQAGQKSAAPPDAEERAKLKKDIAAMKATIEKMEAEYQARQKQAEAEKERKLQDEATLMLKAELLLLQKKLKAVEVENAKLQPKQPLGVVVTFTEARKQAAEALLQLGIRDEETKAAQAKKAIEEEQRAIQERLAPEAFRGARVEYLLQYTTRLDKSDDAAFLQRVIKQCYGVPATALELKYFAEDKDPKKREKLVELVLKDPAVFKKLGPDAKEKLLAQPTPRAVAYTTPKTVEREIYTTKFKIAEPFAKLLDQVLDGKRTDEQIADAISLATLGRYPSEAEQKMALAAVAGASDKRAAWKKVVETLAGTKEAQAHAESLKKK